MPRHRNERAERGPSRPWRRSTAACVAMAMQILLFAACRSPAAPVAGDLLISNVRLLAQAGGKIEPGRSVLVAGDEIVWIGAASEESRIAAARRVEGAGAVLAPGLVDLHVHLHDPRDLLALLRHGVTTVVDLSGGAQVLEWRAQVAAGRLPGPQIFSSGAPLDGDPGRGGGNVPLGSAEVARLAVAEQVAAGYDAVKIYDLIEEEAYAAAVEAARGADRPVFGHIPKALGLEGIVGRHDVVAHGEEYYYTYFRDTDDRGRLAEAARLTAEAELAVIPNTGFFRAIIDQAEDLDAFLDRDEMRFVAPGTLADWLPESNRYIGREAGWLDNLRRMHPFLRELTRELHRAGVQLFAGSDAGAIGGVPGASLLAEIAELQASGLSRAEALAAATSVPGEWLARRVGAGPRGRVEIGARADFVLLEADPRDDLAALAGVRAVVAGGRWHDVDELDRRLRDGAPAPTELLAWYRGIRALVAARDLDALAARLASGPSAIFAEKVVNALAYRRLYSERDVEGAVELFALNSRTFPASGNVWDSLGEALAERGDRAAALASYEKSLAFDPGNDNARRRIERLRAR